MLDAKRAEPKFQPHGCRPIARLCAVYSWSCLLLPTVFVALLRPTGTRDWASGSSGACACCLFCNSANDLN